MIKYVSLRWIWFLPFVLFLTGCPYSSDVPIDEPKEKVNKDYIGKWVKVSSSNKENPKYYQVTEKDDKLYIFEEFTYNSTDKKYNSDKYTGHTSTLGSVVFLNLEKNGKYYFYKIELSNDKKYFKLYEVTDNIDEKFNNSTDLKAFFDKYKDLSFFYNKDEEKYEKQ